MAMVSTFGPLGCCAGAGAAGVSLARGVGEEQPANRKTSTSGSIHAVRRPPSGRPMILHQNPWPFATMPSPRAPHRIVIDSDTIEPRKGGRGQAAADDFLGGAKWERPRPSWRAS